MPDALVAVETRMCGSCELIEQDLARAPEAFAAAARRCGVRAVPTIVIDGLTKVEGNPDFPWICSDEFYRTLERRYPLLRQVE